MKSLSHVQLFATPWTVAPRLLGLNSKGLLFPSPGESSQPRDRTWVSRIVGRRFTVWACQLNWTELSKLWWGLRFHPTCKLPSQPDSFMAAVWSQKAPWASASCWCCRLPCSPGGNTGGPGRCCVTAMGPLLRFYCVQEACLTCVLTSHICLHTERNSVSVSPAGRYGDILNKTTWSERAGSVLCSLDTCRETFEELSPVTVRSPHY